MREKTTDMIGKKFGKLVVIEVSGKNKQGRLLCLCKCDCGREKIVALSDLRRGHIKSCGCLHTILEKTGTRYGHLVIIKRAPKRRGRQIYWWCKCDCGNKVAVPGYVLREGITKSCGCSKRLPKGERGFIRIFRQIKRQAKKKNRECCLSKKEAKELIDGHCFYCGALPSNTSRNPHNPDEYYIYNGIDRVDSSEGYTSKNTVLCCIDCNMAKSAKTIPEFLDWFKRVIKHNNWDVKNIDNISKSNKIDTHFQPFLIFKKR